MADTISGVTTIAGVPGQARVALLNIDTDTIVASALSNASTGVFEFTGLDAGTYELLIRVAGYKPVVHGPWALDGTQLRITDAGDIRITDSGDRRITE